MTHIYLYIECGASLDNDSHFYYVTIGESQREARIYRHELLKKIDPAYYAICQLRKK